MQVFGSVETFNSSVVAVANPLSNGVTVQKVLRDMFHAGLFDVPLYLGRETAVADYGKQKNFSHVAKCQELQHE